jgi:membrane fusion protein (multidrug efflux system)
MSRRSIFSSVLLLASIAGAALGLAAWKHAALEQADAEAAAHPEPAEAITLAVARQRQDRKVITAIGTVWALRSITLRNELPGTVAQVALTPGQVVETGTVLVTLDVAVEEAELRAQQAQAALAETLLRRMERASKGRAASELDVERARAERDVALAQIARIEAIIARKTLRAPFRARVGMADVHVGQYLQGGTELTTLQGVDDAVHVDFRVPQPVAAGLRPGHTVEVLTIESPAPALAEVVAIDARIDPETRNAVVRARVGDAGLVPPPGASVRVRVPVGPPVSAVAVPVTALRRGPAGDHVFAVAADPQGNLRAQLRPVRAGGIVDGEVLIHEGVAAGEQVAASGSFKLRDGALVIAVPAADHHANGHANGHNGNSGSSGGGSANSSNGNGSGSGK